MVMETPTRNFTRSGSPANGSTDTRVFMCSRGGVLSFEGISDGTPLLEDVCEARFKVCSSPILAIAASLARIAFWFATKPSRTVLSKPASDADIYCINNPGSTPASSGVGAEAADCPGVECTADFDCGERKEDAAVTREVEWEGGLDCWPCGCAADFGCEECEEGAAAREVEAAGCEECKGAAAVGCTEVVGTEIPIRGIAGMTGWAVSEDGDTDTGINSWERGEAPIDGVEYMPEAPDCTPEGIVSVPG